MFFTRVTLFCSTPCPQYTDIDLLHILSDTCQHCEFTRVSLKNVCGKVKMP